MPLRILKIAAIVIGAVLLLGVLAIALLHLPASQDQVWSYGRASLADQYGVALSASRVRYNLLRLSITLDDLSVAAADRPEAPPLLSAARFMVDLGWRRLLNGGVHIQDAAIENLILDLQIDEQGGTNIP